MRSLAVEALEDSWIKAGHCSVGYSFCITVLFRQVCDEGGPAGLVDAGVAAQEACDAMGVEARGATVGGHHVRKPSGDVFRQGHAYGIGR